MTSNRRVLASQARTVLWSVLRGVLIFGIALVIMYPLLIKLSLSFMSVEDMFDVSRVWIPSAFNFDNYRMTWVLMNYPKALVESFALAMVVSVAQLASCALVGYGFGRFRYRFMDVAFLLVIFTLVVPPQLIMVPLYFNFRFFNVFGLIGETGFNLLGTYWPFVLTALTGMGPRNGIFIYIIRQFFRGMPQDLEEAAYIDGAGPLKCFFRVMLPSAVPALVIVFLFAFVWQWNDSFYATLYRMDRQGLANSLLGIASQLRGLGFFSRTEMIRVQEISIYLNTGMLLFSFPVILIYAVLQRFFVESVDRTGLVG